MSTLARFRRTGGLLQLLQLIETSEKDKQTHLIELVSKEDPGWAHLIKVKRLTLERIMGWPDAVVAEVFDSLAPSILSCLYYYGSSKYSGKVERCIPKRMQREYLRVRGQRKPNEQEEWVAQVRLIQVTRERILGGNLRLSAIDPGLEIDLRLVS